MRTIVLDPSDIADDQGASFIGQLLKPERLRPRHVVRGEDTDVLLPDGTLLVRFRTNVIDRNLARAALGPMSKVGGDVSNRGVAAGAAWTGLRPIREDGTRSKSTRIDTRRFPWLLARHVGSGVVGSMDRYARFPYCRTAIFQVVHPRLYLQALPLFQRVSELFGELIPERHQAQAEICARTHPAWVIPGTVFTTVTVNRNFQTAVHRDAGDFPGGFGVLTTLEAGHYSGGETVLPGFNVAVDVRMGDLILYDVHLPHGNFPIVGRRRGRTPEGDTEYMRIACVFYYRNRMHLCGTPEQELERAKRRKAGDKLHESLNPLEAGDDA